MEQGLLLMDMTVMDVMDAAGELATTLLNNFDRLYTRLSLEAGQGLEAAQVKEQMLDYVDGLRAVGWSAERNAVGEWVVLYVPGEELN